LGFIITEDRGTFDYIYLKENFERLDVRLCHKNEDPVKTFMHGHSYEGRTLLPEYTQDTIWVLEDWKRVEKAPGYYGEYLKALTRSEELFFCGGIYSADGRLAAFCLRKEISDKRTYVIYFEKALLGLRGLYQLMTMSFAPIFPVKYRYISRKRDLMDEGLQKAKMSCKPNCFTEKYRATA
jgi:hypothetical protein